MKNIDGLEIFMLLFFLFMAGWIISIIIGIGWSTSPEYRDNIVRKIKICRTYSNDFWRNDIDFIDGKCYYKGKEVEIK
ncbi:MAG: hypothetical protein Q4A23_00040 [bacterium]|nr:hypothetical protein [bacterium]